MRSLITCSILLGLALPVAAAPVAVSQPLEREITDYAEFTGRLAPAAQVELRARVDAALEKVLFQAGAAVNKGELLFQLDDRAFRLALQKAQAELALAEARLKRAQAEHRRGAELAKTAAISKEELEKLAASLDEATAGIQVARAAIELARLNLEYCRIVSPINGKIGPAMVSAGNLVRADQTVLAQVVALNPLHLQFEIDEQTLLKLQRKDGRFPLQYRFRGEKDFLNEAVGNVVSPAINDKTGTVLVRTAVPNLFTKLQPGWAADVRLALGEPRKALLVADEAIQDRTDGKHVLVVNAQNIVEDRPVKTGPLINGLRVIETGLKAGEWVVIGRVAGLKAGDKVEPRRIDMPAPTPPSKSERPSLPAFPGAGPALLIRASYPGASARTVEQAVAAPIEQAVKGMENVEHSFFACRDGELQLTITFKKGTDLDQAATLVQNRVNTAYPLLPESVQRTGITIQRQPVPLLGVALLSPDGSRDREVLSKLAIDLRDELSRVSGIAEVTLAGAEAGPYLQIELVRLQLAVRGITPADVDRALRELEPGEQAWRRKPPEQLANLIVKADENGIVRLRDVARIELVKGWPLVCNLDGKPCVFLLVAQRSDSNPKETAKAVQSRLADLAKRFPAGIEHRVIPGDK